MALEMMRNMSVVYINLRGPKSSGKPPRTKIADVVGKLTSEVDFKVFLWALFSEMARKCREIWESGPCGQEQTRTPGWYWKGLSRLLLEEVSEANTFWDQIERRCTDGIATLPQELLERQKKAEAFVTAAKAPIEEMTNVPRAQENKNGRGFVCCCSHTPPPCSLVVLDEVRGLFEGKRLEEQMRFFSFRRALTYVTDCKFMFMLIDTLSSVQIYAVDRK